MTVKQLTRIGVFHIEEVILDTLFQVNDEYMRTRGYLEYSTLSDNP